MQSRDLQAAEAGEETRMRSYCSTGRVSVFQDEVHSGDRDGSGHKTIWNVVNATGTA